MTFKAHTGWHNWAFDKEDTLAQSTLLDNKQLNKRTSETNWMEVSAVITFLLVLATSVL